MAVDVLHKLDYFYYTLVVCFSLIGNSLVIVSIKKFPNLRSKANYLTGILAVSDFTMACTWPVLIGKYGMYRAFYLYLL